MATTDRFALRFLIANLRKCARSRGHKAKARAEVHAPFNFIRSVREAVLTHMVYRLGLRRLSLDAPERKCNVLLSTVAPVPLLQY